jgi:signal transduction histidine kinase
MLTAGSNGERDTPVIGYASTLGLLSVAGLAALWLRFRSALHVLMRERAGLAAILDTSPIRSFRFVPGAKDAGEADDYADFLRGLAPGEAGRIEAARRALQCSGDAFSVSAATIDGTAVTIEGRRAANGGRVLWLLDGSAPAARREREAALQEAAMLRETIDAIPMPMWRRDARGGIVECNRAYRSSPGLMDIRSSARLRVLPPAGGERASADDAAPAGRSLLGHIVIDGARRLLEINEVACGTGGTIGFAYDRTDVEAAQTELWRHINAHGEVLEGIHAGVAVYGANQRLKYFNTAFAALWGMDEEWLAGEPSLGEVLEWLRERRRIPEFTDFRAYKREHLALFTTLIGPRQELMHLPDGRTLQLTVSPHPLGGLIFLHEDVTDYLALECSLNTLAQVQRATLDHLFEGIAVFGADGRLKLQNPAYRAIWDLSEEDVAGEPHVADIVERMRPLLDDGGDWAGTKQAAVDKIAAQVPTNGLLHRRNGSLLQAATVPLPDGEVLLTYLDVSDSARVEQALREKNEALETADRLKSEFIANVSYELRTPLNAIIGFAEILVNQYFGALSPRQLDYSKSILDSAQQLTALINDILDLATIEAGYLSLERDRVDVCRMLKAVAALTEERAHSRGLELAVCCAPDIGTIDADERRLKQALFNLISNAIKFTPPGGTVSVEAERRGADLLLSVADTGVGIDPADHDRIFDKFERGAGQSGAGLGLSLVKKLIELHGGSVGIESAPEHGTRIICQLPERRRVRGKRSRRHAAVLAERAEALAGSAN